MERWQDKSEDEASFCSSWSLEDVLALSPAEFEELIATLWTSMGYRVIRRHKSGPDGGIDVMAKTRHPPYITCAIYASLAYRPNIDVVVIVTSSDFTEEAKEEASQLKVKLMNGRSLVSALNQFKIPKPRSSSIPRVERTAVAVPNEQTLTAARQEEPPKQEDTSKNTLGELDPSKIAAIVALTIGGIAIFLVIVLVIVMAKLRG